VSSASELKTYNVYYDTSGNKKFLTNKEIASMTDVQAQSLKKLKSFEIYIY